MSQRQPLIAGNWKMNLDHIQATHLVQKLAFTLRDAKFDHNKVDVAVLVPFTDLRTVQTLIDGDALLIRHGAQDLSAHDEGAYTGEVSGAMLSALGCAYVVVGHSERRQYHAENDQLVAAKTRAALRHGITPIVCVGEGLEIRQAGTHVAHTVGQVQAALADATPDQVASLVIAYEPVWAIGTGEVATPDDAQEVCQAIRQSIADSHGDVAGDSVRVLYGGSVKSGSIAALMSQPDVDGALVGGASLDATEFAAICRFNDHHTTI